MCLTKSWNDGKAYLRGTFGPAGRHERTLSLLLARNRLLINALEHLEREEYEASVLIVLSQIDGLVFDLTDPPYGFFYDGKDHDFVDDATVAGMPVFLRAVRRAVLRDPRTTSLIRRIPTRADIPRPSACLRHAHQRDKGFRVVGKRGRVAKAQGPGEDRAGPVGARGQVRRFGGTGRRGPPL